MRRDIFQALSDPTRRAIILLIALQEMTPNALAENFSTTRQAVSKHLRILIECDLVEPHQKGREIFYSLKAERMREIDQYMQRLREIWETRFNQLDSVLETLKTNDK